jgi:hypothetical protein
MDSRDRLELLEGQLALIDAVTRAIAYNSPSAAEEHRAQLNREVLDLREELGLAVEANPGLVDSRGDVGAGRPENATERGQLAVEQEDLAGEE